MFGPVYNRLLEYDSWENKQLVPALAVSVDSSADGKHWVIRLRPNVTWHSGEPFTAYDVKFTWDMALNKAYASDLQANLASVFGSTAAYKVTGPLEITVDLPAYSILFREQILGAVAIMPEHAYKDIKPEALRGHVANTWLGSYQVKTTAGKTYTAHGGIGTGPWIAMGFDPSRKAYRYAKNPNYWQPTTGNVTTYYVVNIQGTDAVLSALKAGDIDAHDPMYDIGSLLGTDRPEMGQGAAVRFLQMAAHLLQSAPSGVRHRRRDAARQAGPGARGRGRRLCAQGVQPGHPARADRQGDRQRPRSSRHRADPLVGAGIRSRTAASRSPTIWTRHAAYLVKAGYAL